MGKKIGKRKGFLFFALVQIFGALFADPHVALKFFDTQGNPLQIAQVLVPFIVEVTVADDSGKNLPSPHITGLDKFAVRGTTSSSSMTTRNGQTSFLKKFRINVVAQEEGTYSVGPVTAIFDGQEVKADAVNLTVGSEQKAEQPFDHDPFVTMTFNPEQLYVGQRADVTLRFYYPDNEIRLQEMREPSFEGFTVLDFKGPVSGTETIDGELYHYLEWTAALFAQKSGPITIEPVEALCSKPASRNRQRGGFFADVIDFFGGGRSLHRLHSNSVRVQVRKLPEHTPAIEGVGEFKAFKAYLENSSIKKGDAVVFNLDLIGSGNISLLQHPALNLPEQLTVYHSKSRIVREGDHYKKTFEYIVQALEPGEHIIGAQHFVFFDPQEEKLRVLESNPVALTVQEASTREKNNNESDVERADDESLKGHEVGIIASGQWKKRATRSLSPNIFSALMFFPLLMLVGLWAKRKRDYYRELRAPEIRYKNAFNNARLALRRARMGNYDTQLYHVFMELFAARLKIPIASISEDLIEQTLRNAGLSPEKLVQWRLLFAHMAEKSFSSYGISERNDKLFNQAAYWLSELEKLL